MSRFKEGQTVYMDRGDKLRTLVVAKVIDNPMIPIYQYSFETPNDGFICGEQSIRDTIDGPDLTLRECMDKNPEEVPTRINTFSSATRHPINMNNVEEVGDVSFLFSDCDLFFKPSLDLVKWLREYAGDRLIIDVGCGQGHLVNMLRKFSPRAIGIEPNFDLQQFLKIREVKDREIGDINEILQGTVQQHKTLIQNLGKDKCMLVFARPSHNGFVEEGIFNMPEGMEALYITLPENLTLYDDLGQFRDRAKLIEHKGVSEDNEVIYSIIR